MNARNRIAYLTAWAVANGETIEGTPLGSSSKAIQNYSSDRSFGATLVIGLIGLTSILGYSFVMKKRRVI